MNTEARKKRPYQRLILGTSQDSDPSQSFGQTTHRGHFALTIALAIVLALLIFTPRFAGAQNLLGGIFGMALAQNSPTLQVHDTNAGLLKAAVHSDPNPAKGGADITVADDSALVSEGVFAGKDSASLTNRNGGQISLYVVREGDSLSQIAQMFDVSVNTIIWANELKSSKDISAGDTLVILPVSGVKYTVKKGGTVQDIAELYDGDAEEIALFNGLSINQKLEAGTEVIIPGGEMANSSVHQHTPASGGSVAASGYYTNPVPGSVRTQGIHGYNAVDLGARSGTAVVAAASGSVIISREGAWNGGYGNYIVIKHDNGTQTLYAHNSSNIVSVGQWVVQGQVIGYVGSTGRSTGPHLHFEVRGAVNPFAY